MEERVLKTREAVERYFHYCGFCVSERQNLICANVHVHVRHRPTLLRLRRFNMSRLSAFSEKRATSVKRAYVLVHVRHYESKSQPRTIVRYPEV
jgi:hypothetical protein